MLIQLSDGDVFAGLSMIVLVIVIGGLITAFSIARARKRGSTTLALDVTRNASFMWVMLMGLSVVFVSVKTFTSSTVDLDDEAYTEALWQEEFLLAPACSIPPGEDASGLACGSSIEGVGLAPRLLLLAGVVLSLLASAAIAWAIHTAAKRAGERRPFHSSVSRTFGAVAIIVLIAAVVGGLMQQVGMTLALRSLSWAADAPEIMFRLSIPLWPFAVSVGLFALSAIFRYGRQLQEEAARLQKETEGLV